MTDLAAGGTRQQRWLVRACNCQGNEVSDELSPLSGEPGQSPTFGALLLAGCPLPLMLVPKAGGLRLIIGMVIALVWGATLAACDSIGSETPPSDLSLTWRVASLPESEGEPLAVTAGEALYAVHAWVQRRYTPFNRMGYHVSTDGGLTWTHHDSVGTDRYPYPHEVFRMEAGDGAMLFAVAAPHGTSSQLIRSLDGGSSWQAIGGGLSEYQSLAFRSDGALFAVNEYVWEVENACAFSPDAGTTWTQHRLPDEGSYNIRRAFLGAGPKTVYAGIDKFYRSTDGGETWEATILSPPSRVTVSGDGVTMAWKPGTRVSVDDGVTWTAVVPPVALVSVLPHLEGFIALGRSERGYTVYRVLDGGERWVPVVALGAGLEAIREHGVGTPTLQQLSDGRLVVSVLPMGEDEGKALLLISEEGI